MIEFETFGENDLDVIMFLMGVRKKDRDLPVGPPRIAPALPASKYSGVTIRRFPASSAYPGACTL